MITQKIIARTDSLKLDKIISRYGEDSMRQVVFIIVRPDPESEELIPITIPEDAVGSFRILKPSGNFVIVPMSKSVLASGETAFDVVLPASANTAKGSGYYDIRITSETDKYYFTAQGDFIIDDNIISDEVLEDVSEVNGLIFPDDFLTVEDHVAYIDDDVTSTESTWSSDKISEEIEAHAGGDVSKTVSGNPITFDDGASAPLVKCVTEIQGSQDLHGYDKPWVGGAGKNKMPFPTLAEIKTINTTGTWSNNSYVINGITFTLEYSTNGSVEYVNVNGTASSNAALNVFRRNATVPFTLPSNTYILNGVTQDSNVEQQFQCTRDGALYDFGNDRGSGVSASVLNTDFLQTTILVISGKTVTNSKVYPMIRLSTESDPTFAPYSNICPITAYTEGEIEVSDGDGNTTTHTTTYPSAIYRGSEDVVNGTVECEVKYFTPTTWSRNTDHSYYTREFMTELASTGNVPCICDKLKEWDGEEPTTNYGICFVNSAGAIRINTVNAYASVEDMVADIGEMHFACTLPTPTTSPVTPTNLPIKSLLGYNHIESTTGEMEVEYITERFQPLIDSIKQL